MYVLMYIDIVLIFQSTCCLKAALPLLVFGGPAPHGSFTPKFRSEQFRTTRLCRLIMNQT